MKNCTLGLLLTLIIIHSACLKPEESSSQEINYREDPVEWMHSETWMHLEGGTTFTPPSDAQIMYIATDGDEATAKFYASSDAEVRADSFIPTGNGLGALSNNKVSEVIICHSEF